MLEIADISVHIAGRPLLENASLRVTKGEKIGLVGRNGCGKTTLFKAITGNHPLESGDIKITGGWRIGQVAQEAPATEQNLVEVVLEADTQRTALLAEAETATAPDRIAEIQTELADMDAFSAEARAAAILAGLGFDADAQQRPVSSFSGGWRMRVALAAVLFSGPDLLLLDEPTNYLDIEGSIWLEAYLSRYPGAVIIISHDRDLLNTAVRFIVHMHDQSLTLYRGNYDLFEKQREAQREIAEKTRTKIEAQASHMQAFVDRFRYKASKARQAQSKLKAIAKLKPPAALEEAGTVAIRFPNPQKSSVSPIVKMEGVSCGYSAEAPVLSRLRLNIDADDRIALLGANGNGKSTFAKLLCNRMPFVDGEIVKPAKISVSMFAQHQMDDLETGQTAVEQVRALMSNVPDAKVRARVAQMGLDRERMDTPCESLSGGEKARLLLGKCTFHSPDLLILDEPTNHLDVGAREALIHAINDFAGAVILVSHDRHLIDATMERLWLVKDGYIAPYDDDLDAYRAMIMGRKSTRGSTNTSSQPIADNRSDIRKSSADRRRDLAPIRAQISEKEKQIQKLEVAIQKLDSSLATPGIYENYPDKAREFAKKRADADKMMAQLEADWLALSEQLEEPSA